MKKALTGLVSFLTLVGSPSEAIAQKLSVKLEGEARYRLSMARNWEHEDLWEFIKNPFPAAAGVRGTIGYGAWEISGFYGNTQNAKKLVPPLNLGEHYSEGIGKSETFLFPREP